MGPDAGRAPAAGDDPLAILLAEDDGGLRRLMERLLVRAGHDVRVAADGDAAIEALQEAKGALDVLVLDAQLAPRGAGEVIERAQLLCAGGREPALVLVSGAALEGDLAGSLERAGSAFLRKPFAPQALLDAVGAATASLRPATRSRPGD